MPLTAVVSYFNAHLDDFNRASRLRTLARFDYHPEQSAVSAELDGITLRPHQLPLFNSELSAPVAFESKLAIEDEQGRELNAKALYYTAWEAEEVIFLDRFLRVLHTLDHLARHRPDADGNVIPLILDVHWRHVRAVEASHGQVFQGLLAQLGVEPAQIVLRMQAQMLLEDPHVHTALQSFERLGYRLLVEGLPLDHQHWPLLQQMGVSWIAVDPDFLQAALRNRLLQARLDQWIQSAHAVGLKVWLQSFDTPRALEIAWRLGADAVSGARLNEAARSR